MDEIENPKKKKNVRRQIAYFMPMPTDMERNAKRCV